MVMHLVCRTSAVAAAVVFGDDHVMMSCHFSKSCDRFKSAKVSKRLCFVHTILIFFSDIMCVQLVLELILFLFRSHT